MEDHPGGDEVLLSATGNVSHMTYILAPFWMWDTEPVLKRFIVLENL